MGENISALGSQVGGAADSVAEWLRRRGSGGSAPAGSED
jgi:hypothetical protein